MRLLILMLLAGCSFPGNTEIGMGILIDFTRAVDAVCRWCLP